VEKCRLIALCCLFSPSLAPATQNQARSAVRWRLNSAKCGLRTLILSSECQQRSQWQSQRNLVRTVVVNDPMSRGALLEIVEDVLEVYRGYSRSHLHPHHLQSWLQSSWTGFERGCEHTEHSRSELLHSEVNKASRTYTHHVLTLELFT
jgi:hypothetical protein